jgi:glucose-1-phosphate adenylyltransferase
MPGRPDHALVNMGVYVWNTEALVRHVAADATSPSGHDFGKDIIPRMVEKGDPVYAHFFTEPSGEGQGFWRDIGTLESYWRTSLELAAPVPELNLYDADWPLRGSRLRRPPAKSVGDVEIVNSLLAPGCIISGAHLEQSVLSPGARLEDGAVVTESVILDDVCVGAGARIHRAIVDEGARIPPGCEIGVDAESDRQRFAVTEEGLVIVPAGAVIE